MISALKIVSLPSFLSPGNSLLRESVRTWLRPTPYINDLPTALTGSFFNVLCCSPCLAHNGIISSSLLINGAYSVYMCERKFTCVCCSGVKDKACYLMEESSYEIPSSQNKHIPKKKKKAGVEDAYGKSKVREGHVWCKKKKPGSTLAPIGSSRKCSLAASLKK